MFIRGALLNAMTGEDYNNIAGIQCRGCGWRKLLPLPWPSGEINGGPLPPAGPRCGRCSSTTFAWRRFLTVAEGDAWVAENIVSGV